MSRATTPTRKRRLAFGPAAALLAVACLGGCAFLQPNPPAQTATVAKPRVAPPPQRVAPPSGLIVLQTEGSSAYAGVAREILQQWPGSIEVIHVARQGGDAKAQQRAQKSGIADIVAIGLPAARIARSLAGKKVVFCQVFNYEEEDLIRPWMKGVSALSPVRQQFKAWKELDPQLRNVAVISGDGLSGLMAEAQAAAVAQDIKLQHIKVHSDLGLRSAAKGLGPEVQGLWLVPDNRVLSQTALREILAQSRARGRQVLAMNEQLLSWGATLSAESDFADIARQALSRIRTGAGHSGIPGPDLVPLTKTNIRTNRTLREPGASGSPAHEKTAAPL